MAKWVNSSVLDNGPNSIKTQATTLVKMLLLSAYTAGDSYATVVANQLNAGVTMANADFAMSTGAAGSRVLTITTNGKTDTATASTTGTPDLHIAFTDGSANVLYVTDETSNQAITSGNPINFPISNLTYTSGQPV